MQHFSLRVLILQGFLVCSFNATGQELDALSQFTLSANDGKVIIEWTIARGNTCQGVGIFRSADSIQFEQIGEISGICGSNETSISYSFVDEQPIANAINYYKLSLGFLGESQILDIHVIVFDGTNFQIRPNPIRDLGQIVFKNDQNVPHDLVVYQDDGRLLFTQQGNQDFFQLDLRAYPAGVYRFVIRHKQSGHITSSGNILRQ